MRLTETATVVRIEQQMSRAMPHCMGTLNPSAALMLSCAETIVNSSEANTRQRVLETAISNRLVDLTQAIADVCNLKLKAFPFELFPILCKIF